MGVIPGLEDTFIQDNLTVMVFESRADAGARGADLVASALRSAVSSRGGANIALAAAPSQNEFLDALALEHDIVWQAVNCFQLDEYHTLTCGAPQRFDTYLEDRIIRRVRPGRFMRMVECRQDVASIAARYTRLLREYPLDVACLGIGENGHLAFNDPPVADFNDIAKVKEVTLDEPCRVQQVYDGAFPSIDDVPKTAVTMTIPALMSAKFICCTVPGPRKAKAVYDTLRGPIDESCPASILRTHNNAVLLLDTESASMVRG